MYGSGLTIDRALSGSRRQFAGRHGNDYGCTDNLRDVDHHDRDKHMRANDPRNYYGPKDSNGEYYQMSSHNRRNRSHMHRGAYRNPQKLYFARRGG